MIINTVEDFKKLRSNIHLYAINPFSYGHNLQHRVTIDILHHLGALVLDEIGLKFLTVKNFNYPCFNYISSYTPNKVGCPKFFTTDKVEALVYLSRVRSGEFAKVVKDHHDSVGQNFEVFSRG